MTGKRKKDAQVNLSKKSIVKALIQLMREKPYHQISITELTGRANLSRRTFYRHFDTIDDVLTHLLHSIATKFSEYIIEKSNKDLETIIFVYFSYWKKHKDFLLLLQKNNLLYLLLQCFTPEVREKTYAIMDNEKQVVADYSYHFVCGGVWNMLVKWLEEGADYTPRYMKEIGNKMLPYIK